MIKETKTSLPIDEAIYEQGYNQAIKDLTLTLENIELLHTFLYAVKNNKQGAFIFTRLSDEQYGEVLQRFNQRKMKDQLLELGWIDKGDVLVRYSNPRIGWKPSDGTLIIGYHEYKDKVHDIEKLEKIIEL